MLKAKRGIPMAFLADLALMAVAPSQAALINDFTGPYGVFNWTPSIQGDGTIYDIDATSIVLTGADDTGGAKNVDLTIAAVGSGTVSFDWSFTTTDTMGPFYDPFGYLFNGVFNQLTDDDGQPTQSGAASFSVFAGDLFGFRQASVDSIFGAASTTISAFSAPGVSVAPDVNAVPEPASIALLGLGLAGLGLMRRRRV